MKPALPTQGRADASDAPVLGAESGAAGERDPVQKGPHQVHGVEDLHLSDGGAAWVRQVAIVVVYGQRAQACGTRGTQHGQSGPGGPAELLPPGQPLSEVCVSRPGRSSPQPPPPGAD